MLILGQILATALLGLEDAGLGYSNQATIPQDINSFVQGIFQIWFTHPAGAASSSSAAAVAKIKKIS